MNPVYVCFIYFVVKKEGSRKSSSIILSIFGVELVNMDVKSMLDYVMHNSKIDTWVPESIARVLLDIFVRR